MKGKPRYIAALVGAAVSIAIAPTAAANPYECTGGQAAPWEAFRTDSRPGTWASRNQVGGTSTVGATSPAADPLVPAGTQP